ncbi:MAG TPA: prolipoprotein diacylglyceryl transferase family protein [Acidimicrobiia bacterium]|nr:prolipoprotein diacylglyceryl transferase family protein [Acidimicrobiia bacterium]
MVAVISYPPIPIFELGPLRLSLHGLLAAIGFLAGAWLANRELEKRGFDTEKYQSALLWGFVGALLGARYLTAPAALLEGTPLLTALNPVSGNFSIMGGFVGGIVGGLIRMRQVDLSVWPTLDVSAFGLALGTVVGRIGDLAIVEHLGRATSVPWGYGIKPGYDVAPQHDALECTQATVGADGFCGVYHHVAAYDLIGAAILLGALFVAYRRLRFHYGQLFSVWVIWYGFQRLLLDSLRFGMGDAQIGSITWNQLSGFVAGLGGVALFWYLELRQPPVDTEEDRKRGAVLEPASDIP